MNWLYTKMFFAYSTFSIFIPPHPPFFLQHESICVHLVSQIVLQIKIDSPWRKERASKHRNKISIFNGTPMEAKGRGRPECQCCCCYCCTGEKEKMLMIMMEARKKKKLLLLFFALRYGREKAKLFLSSSWFFFGK